MKQYLIRLDDACPTMHRERWERMFGLLDANGVRPMVGVIPRNQDPQQHFDPEDPTFWQQVRLWQNKGYTIALHGYSHVCDSQGGLSGLNPMWARSEFAGHRQDVQNERIRGGYNVFGQHGISVNHFFAPSHTFDEGTLRALRDETSIRIISDTLALRPYRRGDFMFIPQFGGQCREMRLTGTYTFCLHPSTMSEAEFARTEAFLCAHRAEFVGFDQLDITHLGGKHLADRLLTTAYFALRRLRGQR